MPSFYLANILAILGMFTVDLLLFSVEATKNNFHNYFKKRALTGRRMTEANLQELIDKFERKSEKKSVMSIFSEWTWTYFKGYNICDVYISIFIYMWNVSYANCF